jgi:hypothetical protein
MGMQEDILGCETKLAMDIQRCGRYDKNAPADVRARRQQCINQAGGNYGGCLAKAMFKNFKPPKLEAPARIHLLLDLKFAFDQAWHAELVAEVKRQHSE